MLRLLIGLRMLRGPRPSKPVQSCPGSGRRRVLLGTCCVLIASAATHSSAGRAASPGPITSARARIARHIQDPSALFFTGAETRRGLGQVDRVDLNFGVYGTDFSAIVLYKPLTGDLTGQVILSRLPDANRTTEEQGCRARRHKVTRVNIGRYHRPRGAEERAPKPSRRDASAPGPDGFGLRRHGFGRIRLNSKAQVPGR
jgi:hypothetical protein